MYILPNNTEEIKMIKVGVNTCENGVKLRTIQDKYKNDFWEMGWHGGKFNFLG